MRKKSNFFIWIILLLILFLIFIYFSKSSNVIREKSLLLLSPVQEFFLMTGTDFSLNMDKTKENIEILRKENRKLSSKVSSLLLLKEENEALKKALNFELPENTNLIFSKIIGKDILTGKIFITHNNNPKKGMAVVNEEGVLIGVLEERIGNNVSMVRLITSSESALEIKVQNKDLPIGVLRGDDRNVFIEFLPREKGLQYGDYVVTVPNDTGITKEIYIGRVYKITYTDVDPFKSAKVWQGINYRALNYLFIIN